MKFVGVICFSALSLLVLTASFAFNFFEVGEPFDPQQWKPRVFDTFQTDSEISVTLMLQKTRRDGLLSTGGLMMLRELDKEPYYSAFGLQGQFFSLLFAITGMPFETFVERARTGMAFFTALVITAMGLWTWREMGITAAVFLIALTAISDWLVFAARNLYCAYALNFIPTLAGLLAFPLLLNKGRFKEWHYLLLIGACVFVKSLCYYDYITNIILSTAIAPLYYGFARQMPWRSTLRIIILSLFISTMAVVLAITANVVLVAAYKGSFAAGLNTVAERAISRMGGTNIEKGGVPRGISRLVMLEYLLLQPAISIPFRIKPFCVLCLFVVFYLLILPGGMFGLIDSRFLPAVERERRKLLAWTIAAVWGLFASLSWGILMKGHMFHHAHMNMMMLYIPYMLMIYILLGKVAATLATPWLPPTSSKLHSTALPLKKQR